MKTLQNPANMQIKQALYEFSNIIGQDSYVTLVSKHSQESFMQLPELVLTNNKTPFVKIKALIIDFHPRIIGLGIIKQNNKLSYTGLMKL